MKDSDIKKEIEIVIGLIDEVLVKHNPDLQVTANALMSILVGIFQSSNLTIAQADEIFKKGIQALCYGKTLSQGTLNENRTNSGRRTRRKIKGSCTTNG